MLSTPGKRRPALRSLPLVAGCLFATVVGCVPYKQIPKSVVTPDVTTVANEAEGALLPVTASPPESTAPEPGGVETPVEVSAGESDGIGTRSPSEGSGAESRSDSEPEAEPTPRPVDESQAAITPIGWFDGMPAIGYLAGWALDPVFPEDAISVHFYIPAASGAMTFIGSVEANLPRNDVNQATGYAGDHGFIFPLPSPLERINVTVYAYAVTSNRAVANWAELSGGQWTSLGTRSHFAVYQTRGESARQPAWDDAHALVLAYMDAYKSLVNLAFIGDSITGLWASEAHGASYFRQYFASYGAANLGFGGDSTQHVIWRLENGEMPEGLIPKVVVLMIGTNNLGWYPDGHTPEEVRDGALTIIREILVRSPNTKVLLLSILPRGDTTRGFDRYRITLTNRLLMETATTLASSVTYLDLYSDFLDASGNTNTALFDYDYGLYVHPNASGYRILADRILPQVETLMGTP